LPNRLVRLACLIPLLLVVPLVVAAAGNITERAAARPCNNCPEPPPPPPDPDPPAPVEPPAPAPAPTTTETVAATLSVVTDRGAVQDNAGLDCPAGACKRTLTYTRTCPAGVCPAYAFSTITLKLTPASGYAAKWDGCTPHASDPTDCDVTVDSDRTVKVIWTKSAGAGGSVDSTPVRDGSPTTAGALDPNATTTTVSGTVETSRVAARAAKRGEIRSAVRYSFRRSNEWTEFTALSVRYLPRGASVRVACRGGRCPDTARIPARRRTVRLGRLTHRRFAVGTVITVRVSAPQRRSRTTRMIVRRGKDPQIASRSAR
jgi:hypothetical protein